MTKTELLEIAKQIAGEFLAGYTENQDVNPVIIKIVSDHPVTEEQLRRIIEFVNHLVRNNLYRDPKANQAAALFVPGDFNIVAPQCLANYHEQEIIEDAPDYYESPESVIIVKEASAKSRKVREPDTEFIKISTAYKLEKIASKKKSIKDKIAVAAMDVTAKAEAFLKEASDYIRFYNKPKDIIKMAATIDRGAFGDLAKIASMSNAVPKDLKPEFEALFKLINYELPVNYILGDHPLVLRYRGYATARKEVQKLYDKLKKLEEEESALYEVENPTMRVK